MTERAFLSIRETAETLGVSADLVYDLTSTGALPCARLGTRKVVPARAIDLLVERTLDAFDLEIAAAALAAAVGPASAVRDDVADDTADVALTGVRRRVQRGASPSGTTGTRANGSPSATAAAPPSRGAPVSLTGR